MGHRLAFPLGHPHHSSLDRKELVGQSGLVCEIQLTCKAVLVGPKARKVHESNADQHYKRCTQGKAVKASPKADNDARSSFTHGSHQLQKDSPLPVPS